MRLGRSLALPISAGFESFTASLWQGEALEIGHFEVGVAL